MWSSPPMWKVPYCIPHKGLRIIHNHVRTRFKGTMPQSLQDVTSQSLYDFIINKAGDMMILYDRYTIDRDRDNGTRIY